MSKLLATLTALTQDFDLEEWKEDGCPCVKCNLSMRLDDACGWPDDPRLLLCRDCTTDLLSESLAELDERVTMPRAHVEANQELTRQRDALTKELEVVKKQRDEAVGMRHIPIDPTPGGLLYRYWHDPTFHELVDDLVIRRMLVARDREAEA